MKRKGEKRKRVARPVDKMIRFKTDPIVPASFSVIGQSKELSSSMVGRLVPRKTELARLKETWSSLMTDLNKLALDLQGQSPWMTKTVEQLRSSSQKMNNDLMAYVEDSYGHMVKFQGLWMTRASDLSQDLMNTIMNGRSSHLGQKHGDRKCSSEHRTV